MRRPAAEGQLRTGPIWGAKLGVVVTLAAFLLSGCADLPLFHEPAQLVGLATTPKEGQDFIKETHPSKTEFTSVGIETARPPDKPRDAAGVKQLQAELQAQRETGHAILQTLSPPAPAAPPTPAAAAQTPSDQSKAKPSAKQKEEAAAKAKEKPNAKKKKTEPADDEQAAQ
jgi:hypothetical protein